MGVQLRENNRGNGAQRRQKKVMGQRKITELWDRGKLLFLKWEGGEEIIHGFQGVLVFCADKMNFHLNVNQAKSENILVIVFKT